MMWRRQRDSEGEKQQKWEECRGSCTRRKDRVAEIAFVYRLSLVDPKRPVPGQYRNGHTGVKGSPPGSLIHIRIWARS